jgi:photosystem II stability/assembly factor-like uncharacterized protein
MSRRVKSFKPLDMKRYYPLWAVAALGFSGLLAGCGVSSAAPPSAVKSPAVKVPSAHPKSQASVISSALLPWEQAQFTSTDFLNSRTGWVAAVNHPASVKAMAAGLLATRDGGQHWTFIPIKNWTGIGSIDFVSDSSGWLMVTKGGTAHGTVAIIYTDDGGKQWKTQWSSTDFNEALSSKMRIKFVSAQQGYAFTGTQILKTADGGASWERVPFNVAGFSPVSTDMISPETGYAAGSEGSGANTLGVVLKTVDGGGQWTMVFSATPADHYAPYSASIAATGKQHVEVLYQDEVTMGMQVEMSADGGVKWKAQSTATSEANGGYAGPLHFVSDLTGMVPISSGASPVPSGILTTHDGGSHWSESGVKRDWSMNQVDLVTGEDAWATGGLTGSRGDFIVHTTNGGKTWSQAFPFPAPTDALQFYSASSGYGLGLSSNPKALLKTDNGGSSWSLVPTTFRYTPDSVSFSSARDGWALETTQYPPAVLRLEATDSGGKTWETLEKTKVSPTEIIPDHPYLRRFSSQEGLYQQTDFPFVNFSFTNDGGKIRTAAPPKTAEPGTEEESWTSLQDGFLTESLPSAGTSPSRIKFYETDNSGKTWTLSHEFSNVWSQGLSFANGQDGWILAQSHPLTTPGQWVMLKTVNGGKTWTSHSVQGNFEPMGNSVDMQFVNATDGWILGQKGLYRTADGGSQWTLLS